MKANEKKCPRCAEVIKKEALVCKHCGHQFSAEDMAKQQAIDAQNAKGGAIGCAVLLGFLLLIGMCSSGGKDSGAQSGANSTAAVESSTGEMTHEKYVEQLKREVASLEKREPLNPSEWTTKEAITIQVALIGVWGKLYADGANYKLSPAEVALRERFKRLLSAEQIRRFPALRAAQARIFDAGMWENDVDIAALGTGNSRLRVTGGMFAANRNIKSGYEALSDTLNALRFRRVEFEWYRGSESTYYDLKPLGDGVIATLSGSGWSEVK